MIPFKPQERVHLPWQTAGQPVEGTVTAIERDRFRITWDDGHRKPREPRERRWYPAYMVPRFRRGNTTGVS